MQRRTQQRLTVLVLIPILALVAACGTDDTQSGSSAPSQQHNAADVAFATDMVPHHSQAVEMADMALSQADSADVADLAEQIKEAQDPEIAAMSGWLESWGEPVPDTNMGGMGGMDHGGSVPGMTTAAGMRSLSRASGVEFDRLWLATMIEHHEGAVDVAKAELVDGVSVDAKALAQDIVDAQEAEIAIMRDLLSGKR